MTGELDPQMPDVPSIFISTKSKAWRYEREWRIVTGLHQEGGPVRGRQRVLYSFFPHNVAGIYLGCRVTEEDYGEIIQIARDRFPHAALWRGYRPPDRFAILFRPIDKTFNLLVDRELTTGRNPQQASATDTIWSAWSVNGRAGRAVWAWANDLPLLARRSGLRRRPAPRPARRATHPVGCAIPGQQSRPSPRP